MLPVDDVDVAPTAEPARASYRDLGDDPLAGAGLFDTEIDDDELRPVQLLQLGILDTHPGFDDPAQHKHLTRTLRESAQ